MREKDLKSIKEGLGDLAAQAEMDHEIQMARSELYKIAKYAIKLHEMLKGRSEEQGLEAWQQSKITKAADYMGSVYHNLEYEMKFGSQMAESEKQKGVDGKACWDGYKRMGTKKKGGKTVDNCVKEDSYKDTLAQRLDEKSKSKAQQKFMGMVYAAKKGEKPASKDVAKVAKGMSKSDAKDFASTKHKGKPEHVSETKLVESAEVNKFVKDVVDALPPNATMDTIERSLYSTVETIRNKLQSRDSDSFFQGIGRGFKRFALSKDYITRQFLGMTAEKLGLPGLYSMPEGNSFVHAEKDQDGNYKASGGVSDKTAIELYQAGYVTKEKAQQLQIKNVNNPAFKQPPGQSNSGGSSASDDKLGDFIDKKTNKTRGVEVFPVADPTSNVSVTTPNSGSSYTGSVGTATNNPTAARTGGDPSAQFSKAITALAKANNIKNPNLIKVGQTIKLPSGETYTVVKGDTLGGIAAGKFKGTSTPTKKPTSTSADVNFVTTPKPKTFAQDVAARKASNNVLIPPGRR